MSFRAQSWALDAPSIVTAHEMLVLLILALCHNDETDACYPSMEYIARRSHLSRKTVQRSLASLEQHGLIVRRLGGGRKATDYKLFGVPRLKLATLRPDDPSEGYTHRGQDDPAARASYDPAQLFEGGQDDPAARASYDPPGGSSFDPPIGMEQECTKPRGTSSLADPDAPRDTSIPPEAVQLGLARIAELRARLTSAATDEGTHALEDGAADLIETLTSAGGA